MENNYETKPKSGKGLTILLTIVALILLAAVIVLFYRLNDTKKQANETEQYLETQKKSLTSELQDLIGEYDALKTNNDTLNQKLTDQQEKIKKLLSYQASNVQKIKLYEKELKTLRDVLKSYIAQVDSLTTRNQQLIQENTQVRGSLDVAREENVKLSTEKEDLSSKVQKAAVITTSNIVVTPLNKRGKDEDKSTRITKLRVCFTLRENAIAAAGSKEVFIRITRPDEMVLAYSESDVFNFQGQQIVYSAKRQIEYENKDLDVCIFWDNNDKIIVGTYTVDIFTDGALIGTTKFTIKK
jgi:flagellar basal body-associated protein FliL